MQVILTREEKRKARRIIRRTVKAVQATAVAGFFVATFALCGNIENHYKIEAEIVELEGNTYTAVDIDGDEWKFEDDKLFPVGTKVKLKLFNNLTVSIEDDEIVKVKPVK